MRLAMLGFVAMMAGLPGAPRAHGTGGPGHLIVVKMVNQGSQYRFVPSQVTVVPGDTVRWQESSDAPHNVQFDTWPRGAKPGSAQVGPLLTAPGSTYQVVIDNRFPAGTYTYECTPHGSLGMKATLTVAPAGT